MPAAAALALALVTATRAVSVDGATTCPSPAAVEARLGPLLPPGEATRAPDRARLEGDGLALRITLLRADGSEAGRRTLEGTHSCDELAEAAAVIIAAWEDDGAGRPLAAPATAAAPAPPNPAPAVRLSLPIAQAPAVAAPAPPPPAVIRAAPAAPPTRPLRWELAAGAGASLARTALAPAALLSASVGWPALGLRLQTSVSGSRETLISEEDQRSAVWRRALVAAGPEAQLTGARTRAAAFAGVGVSWLSITGQGFDDNKTPGSLVLGLTGSVRLAWNRRRLQPWIEAGASLWPKRSEVYYGDPNEGPKATLPLVEVLLTLGLSVTS